MDGKKQKKVQEEKEKEHYKQSYLRALADYQNLEKRVRQEKEQLKQEANSQLVSRLLTFLDELEKAEIFIKDQGLKMVKDKFYKMLSETGLEEVEVLGKEFDPHLAEAIEVVEGGRENIVVEVLRKGYKYNGKLLRPAQVKVEKKKVEKMDGQKTN